MTDKQMSIIASKIKRLIKENNMTQKELSEKIGISPTTMSDYMNGRSKPSHGVIQKIADYFNVGKSDIDTTYRDNPSGIQPVTKLVKIPILGEIACGVPLLAEQNIEGYREEIADILPTGEVFFLKAKGNSMFPTIPDKSFVLIRRQNEVEDGEIAAVMVNGDTEATLKRVKHQGDMILLMPDNNEFPPYVVNKDNDAKIIGKAIKLSVDL